jgi:predicted DNA-binding transcriptional regulator AlpA
MEIREAKLYTIKEVAEITGLKSREVYSLIKKGRIKAIPCEFKEKIRVFGKFLIEYMEGR